LSDRTSVEASSDATSLGISNELLEILVCPVDHGALEVVENGLQCRECRHIYPVHDGIPSMVPESTSP
jgi:uncharacterized protein YbaR (Trm112 family)